MKKKTKTVIRVGTSVVFTAGVIGTATGLYLNRPRALRTPEAQEPNLERKLDVEVLPEWKRMIPKTWFIATLELEQGHRTNPFCITPDFWRHGTEYGSVDWPLSDRWDLEKCKYVISMVKLSCRLDLDQLTGYFRHGFRGVETVDRLRRTRALVTEIERTKP